MFEFFDKVLGFFEAIGQFIENFFNSLIMAITFMLSSVGFSLQLVAFVPAIIGSAIVIFIAIYVIRFILMK